jgi:phosphatidylglycerophosphatase C
MCPPPSQPPESAPPPLTPGAVLTSDQLIEHLTERLQRGATRAIVLDADGTLWAGDVSEDVFCRMTKDELLSPQAAPRLRQTAADHDLSTEGSASELANTLFRGFIDGTVSELLAYELMTWCFAGLHEDFLDEHVQRCLNEAALDTRLRHELVPVIDWARGEGVRVTIVSASPRFILDRALEHWDVHPDDVRAGNAGRDGKILTDRLVDPVPYNETKVHLATDLLGAESWLAGFGDSPFDLPMLEAADVGVAVYPKKSLRRVLEARGLVELAPTGRP